MGQELSARARLASASPAPWFLAAALVVLAVAGALTLLRARRRHEYAPPNATDAVQLRAVWRGEFALADGARLSAELTALHADAARQRFEADSLRRKLARADGEPWRLRLARASASTPAAALLLSAPRIADADGVAASEVALPHLDGAPQDPVWSLMRRPSGGLGAAQALDLVLWGRAPGDGARLSGLELDGAALEVALERLEVPRSELERPLTHRTRAGEVAQFGKTGGAAASQPRPRERKASDG